MGDHQEGRLDAMGEEIADLRARLAFLEKRPLEGPVVRAAKRIVGTIQPHAAKGIEKTRLGSSNDGGYVCLDDFEGIDKAFSFGINNNASWDVDMATRGITVYQFDHTVSAPYPNNPLMLFEKKMITTGQPGTDRETLPSLVRKHDKGGRRPNLILKIDIENYEWPVFDDAEVGVIDRFTQIVGEFHYFEGLPDIFLRARYLRVLEKLAKHYAVVHIHANNTARVSNFGDVHIPNVLELTFANRAVYEIVDTDETFHGPLDEPCNPSLQDIYLDRFKF